jgi:Protein of unknown function (DUF2939)
MKRLIPAILVLLALLVGYWAWPFFELRALAAAVQAGDVTAINEEVDYPRLRRSFTEQIIGAYLRITGRASQLGALGPLATAVGASIVDPWVSQIVTPENLAQLLRGGTVSSELGPVSFRFGNLPSTLNIAWNAWLSSEYWFNRFSLWLPPGASQADQFRLRMQLLQWHWKVTGFDLPEKLRDQIAGELAKKNS